MSNLFNQVKGNDGNPVGIKHNNPMLVTSEYIVEMSDGQASLNRDISLKSINGLFKVPIDIYLRFLGIAYITMCHDRQHSAVLAQFLHNLVLLVVEN